MKNQVEKTPQWVMVSSSHKKFILVLKLYKLYLLGPSIFLKFNFKIKSHFCYFLVHGLREKREIA